MNPLVQKIAASISNAAEPFETTDQTLTLAHEVISKVRVNGFKPSEPSVAEADFSNSDVLVLKGALLDYTRTHSEHESRGAAYWGLAALHDKSDRDLFRGLLREESTKEFVDEQCLWQIMIALDNIGEDVMEPINRTPEKQSGDTWAASRLYLGRCGLTT